MNDNLENKIEAILFYTAEPTAVSFLTKTLEVKKEAILEAIESLKKTLNARGMRLLQNNDEVSLVTAPELSSLIERIIKEEREKDLGRAGIETLAIIAYKGPVSKKEIEYIRGVNSQWALRNLLLRGLIEKKNSLSDERMMVYSVTSETLRYLGLGNISELPEYKQVTEELVAVDDSILENEEIK
ncbi:MAG: SMC-Scp complex subunit ScpB [Parcubacteria group bacterium]